MASQSLSRTSSSNDIAETAASPTPILRRGRFTITNSETAVTPTYGHHGENSATPVNNQRPIAEPIVSTSSNAELEQPNLLLLNGANQTIDDEKSSIETATSPSSPPLNPSDSAQISQDDIARPPASEVVARSIARRQSDIHNGLLAPSSPSGMSRRGRFTICDQPFQNNSDVESVQSLPVPNTRGNTAPLPLPPLDPTLPVSNSISDLPFASVDPSPPPSSQADPHVRTAQQPSTSQSDALEHTDEPAIQSAPSLEEPLQPIDDGSAELSKSFPPVHPQKRKRKVTFRAQEPTVHFLSPAPGTPNDSAPDPWDFDDNAGIDADNIVNVDKNDNAARQNQTGHHDRSASDDDGTKDNHDNRANTDIPNATVADRKHPASSWSGQSANKSPINHPTEPQAADSVVDSATTRPPNRQLSRQPDSGELAKSKHVQKIVSMFDPPSADAEPSEDLQEAPLSPRPTRRPQRVTSAKPHRSNWENQGLSSVRDGTDNLYVNTLRGGHRTALAADLNHFVERNKHTAGRKAWLKGKVAGHSYAGATELAWPVLEELVDCLCKTGDISARCTFAGMWMPTSRVAPRGSLRRSTNSIAESASTANATAQDRSPDARSKVTKLALWTDCSQRHPFLSR
eukprot:TRINITY_DN12304_c0_g1_i15.p1 TRINITY_DN12304_c0_g1~~TRINITY_DN12304_c0_g1_i15.p1  ORF type:complete len:628 (+),score=68.18 TRINITY_DN12304_c0_g1_i15:124-2007(+)